MAASGHICSLRYSGYSKFRLRFLAEDELSSVFCPAEYNSSGLYDLDAGIHLRGGQLLKRFENKSIDEDRIFVK
jgi:hypothetical protein